MQWQIEVPRCRETVGPLTLLRTALLPTHSSSLDLNEVTLQPTVEAAKLGKLRK